MESEESDESKYLCLLDMVKINVVDRNGERAGKRWFRCKGTEFILATLNFRQQWSIQNGNVRQALTRCHAGWQSGVLGWSGRAGCCQLRGDIESREIF